MLPITIERLGVVLSTNEHALTRPGTASGTLLLARGQTAGRGTRGRRWISPAGEGVFASLVVAPPSALPSPATLSIAAGLALHAATRELGINARLDWPNDLVASDAKLAGILVERRGDGPFVVGIGWNVTTRRFPEELELERAVTSLALEGSTASVSDAETALVSALSLWIPFAWEDTTTLVRAYCSASRLDPGVQVRAEGPSGAAVIGRLDSFTLAEGVTIVPAGEPAKTFALEHLQGLTPLNAAL